MNALLLLPVVVPFATAIACLFGWQSRALQRGLSVAGAAALLAASAWLLWEVDARGIQATQVGNWPAPFGITFVADLLSAIMVLITGVLTLAVLTAQPAAVGWTVTVMVAVPSKPNIPKFAVTTPLLWLTDPCEVVAET